MLFLVDVIRLTAEIFVSAAPFLLAGFFLAGLLRVLIPSSWVRSAIGKNDFRSVLISSLAGIPLPLCSCSVLPAAAAMRQGGASKGATVSFLISTPETGVDSISVSYALLDPVMTVARPLSAFGTAMVAGLATNAVVRRETLPTDAAAATSSAIGKTRDEDETGKPGEAGGSGVTGGSGEAGGSGATSGRDETGGSGVTGEHGLGALPPQQAYEQTQEAVGATCSIADTYFDPAAEEWTRFQLAGLSRAGRLRMRLRTIFDYAYRELLDHILSYFLIGLFISGLIGALIPEGALENPALSGWPSMLLMLVIGIPIYVCDISSTPMAAMLITKGLSPGAALVFLLAGPATNTVSLAVVTKLLGKRAAVTYIASVAVMSLVAGWVVNSFYQSTGISPQASVGGASEIVPAWIEWPAAILALALFVASARRIHLFRGWREGLTRVSRSWSVNLGGRPAIAVYAVVLVLLYLATGLSVVNPGEVGWVLTFGKVSREIPEPGLVAHWPYPISRVERVAAEQVRSVDRGFRQDTEIPAGATFAQAASSGERLELIKEAEIADGDENLLAIRYSAQYTVADAYQYRFGLDDPETLVACMVEYSLRRVMCEQPTDSILVNHHLELMDQVTERLRSEMAILTPSIEILRVDLLDMHAPPEVHFAFRDVASAMEDMHRFVRQAESYRNRVIASGRAQAYSEEASAEAEKTQRVAAATGEAYGFQVLADASRPVREITRLRMQLDAVGENLRKPRLICPITDLPLDLWIARGSGATRWTDLWGRSGSGSTSDRLGSGMGDGTYPGGAWSNQPSPSTRSADEPATGSQETWREKLRRLEESQR